MNKLESIEEIRRKPMRRAHLVNGDDAAVYSAIECGGLEFEQVARIRGLTYGAAFQAYRAKARDEMNAAVRRAKLSVTPPRWPQAA